MARRNTADAVLAAFRRLPPEEQARFHESINPELVSWARELQTHFANLISGLRQWQARALKNEETVDNLRGQLEEAVALARKAVAQVDRLLPQAERAARLTRKTPQSAAMDAEILRLTDTMKDEVIAKKLGISIDAVRSRRQRAKKPGP
jgi:hypothetical protein